MSEVEEVVKRLMSHKGMIGVIIVNNEGIAVRSTLDPTTTTHHVCCLHSVINRARATIQSLDQTNEVTFLRMRSKKHEIMIAPEKDYMLVGIQETCQM